ncbi:hypothetical protein DFH09DRAFT_1121977 [Mycena vulgaris]|nr:hypothetical protein DFH09DRAFT_1121977 [Mycena vulgaris]
MRIISRIFLAQCLFGLSYAANTNRTIDDTNGDSVGGTVPVYSPSSSWAGSSCTGCAIQPSTSDAFDGTWSAATYNSGLGSMTVSMSFTGIAIYVYFILANNAGNGITTTTKANFSIDGTSAGTFAHTPTTSNDLEYNALVFSQTGLSNSSHSLVISTVGSDDIYVNFDYAIYTHEDAVAATTAGITATTSAASGAASSSASTSTTSSTPVGAIAGGVVGGIILLAAIAGLFVFCRRRHRRMLLEDLTEHKPANYQETSLQPTADLISAAPSVHRNTDLPNHYGSDAQSEVGSSSRYGSEPYAPYRPSTVYTHSVVSTSPGGPVMLSPGSYSDREHEPLYPAPGPGFPVPSTPGAQTKAELRRARQMELERQTQEIHEEMDQLTREEEASRSTAFSGADEDTRRRIREMEEQIKALQRQQGSPWAQGLTDEAPPGYTPVAN